MHSTSTQLPAQYNKEVDLLRQIYDNIERDITDLMRNPNKLDQYRVILTARKAQLRNAEIRLAAQRLYLQYQDQNIKGRKKIPDRR